MANNCFCLKIKYSYSVCIKTIETVEAWQNVAASPAIPLFLACMLAIWLSQLSKLCPWKPSIRDMLGFQQPYECMYFLEMRWGCSMRYTPSPITSSRCWTSSNMLSLSTRSVTGKLQRLQIQSKPKFFWRCPRRDLEGPK